MTKLAPSLGVLLQAATVVLLAVLVGRSFVGSVGAVANSTVEPTSRPSDPAVSAQPEAVLRVDEYSGRVLICARSGACSVALADAMDDLSRLGRQTPEPERAAEQCFQSDPGVGAKVPCLQVIVDRLNELLTALRRPLRVEF
jgi:hypothetical protein